MVGLILCVLLTLASYFIVSDDLLTGRMMVLAIMALGVVQAGIQLVYFLNLGHENKPRWNALTFLFMLSVLLIIVIGSLWIMYHLDYHHSLMHD